MAALPPHLREAVDAMVLDDKLSDAEKLTALNAALDQVRRVRG